MLDIAQGKGAASGGGRGSARATSSLRNNRTPNPLEKHLKTVIRQRAYPWRAVSGDPCLKRDWWTSDSCRCAMNRIVPSVVWQLRAGAKTCPSLASIMKGCVSDGFGQSENSSPVLCEFPWCNVQRASDKPSACNCGV